MNLLNAETSAGLLYNQECFDDFLLALRDLVKTCNFSNECTQKNIPYGGKLWMMLTLTNLAKNHPIANFSITNVLPNANI